MSFLLHSLLTESAKHHPEKIAVKYKDEIISYRNLDMSSDQLAALLIQEGVRNGDRVGVLVDKSIDAVIAIFSILKAGACYIPLDPLAPAERQLLILNDCSLEYLISSSKKLLQIRKIMKSKSFVSHIILPDVKYDEFQESFPNTKIVFQDEIVHSEIDRSIIPSNDSEGKSLAYILYTSGSTGQPKGVMISHKASISFVDWVCEYFALNSNDILSAVAPFHFDLSILDIYASIKAGATMCLVPQGASSFPKSMADFIEKEKITTWYSVPSVLTQLVLYGNLQERDLSSLRQILFAGEVFPTKYLRKLMQIIPHAKYYNLFGPTETNVCTYFHVTSLPSSDAESIPIGKPCPGHEAFIVNEKGKLVGENEIGELYMSSLTLMEGYWNDAQKTEKVLIQNPFSKKNDRCYKTGDLVSLNKNNDLDFHGRRDSMIKSRGYRIELSEIETVLSSHPAIKEVVVVGILDEKLGKLIKAIVVLKEVNAISENELKHFCSNKLPIYMIPEDFTFVEKMPRTSTGKVDRHKFVMGAL